LDRYKVRKKGRETLNAEDMESLLHTAMVGHLGTFGDGEPYVTPFNFVYAESTIAIHVSPEGRVANNIRRLHRVCFEVSEQLSITPAAKACKTDTAYRSIILFGWAQILRDREEKRKWLSRMLEKYRPGNSYEPIEDSDLDKTAVVLIHVEKMTGKTHRPP